MCMLMVGWRTRFDGVDIGCYRSRSQTRLDGGSGPPRSRHLATSSEKGLPHFRYLPRSPHYRLKKGKTVSDFIYLDNATTSWPKPDSVYDFMLDAYRKSGKGPGRGSAEAANGDDLVSKVRQRLTEFFGGSSAAPERLVFSYNATDSLNMLIQGVLKRGDHVVATNLEHNAVLRPINHLVRDGGVTVTFVPVDDQGIVHAESIQNAIKDNTRLVVVNHGSNVIGTVQPLAEIGRVCREAGVIFATDSSQTAGVVPIDMQAMNLDVVAFTGHKSLLGSTGIGGLCVAEGVEIGQTRFGGTGILSEAPFQPEDYPWRLEAGTPNLMGIASLWAGQEWIEAQGGVDAIRKHEMALAERLVAGLREIPGVTVYCCDSLANHVATVSMNIEGIEADRAGEILRNEYQIATRTGLHCAPLLHRQLGTEAIGGTVRFGIGALNTEAHIDTAIEAVGKVAERIAQPQ